MPWGIPTDGRAPATDALRSALSPCERVSLALGTGLCGVRPCDGPATLPAADPRGVEGVSACPSGTCRTAALPVPGDA
jgi:hypothetical protein